MEIRAVLGTKNGVENWNYEKKYPRLKRCLTVMAGGVYAHLINDS